MPTNTATIIPVTEFSTFSSEFFIGFMDFNDVFSASFNVKNDDLEPANYSFKCKVAFKEGNNYFESPIIFDEIAVIKNNINTSASGGFTLAIIGFIVLGIIILFSYFGKGVSLNDHTRNYH